MCFNNTKKGVLQNGDIDYIAFHTHKISNVTLGQKKPYLLTFNKCNIKCNIATEKTLIFFFSTNTVSNVKSKQKKDDKEKVIKR